MPRVCTICTHPDRVDIDQGLVGSRPLRQLAALFRVSEDALGRHRADHLPIELARATQAREVARSDDLLGRLQSLYSRAVGLLDTAEASGDLRTAVMAVRETRGCIELLAELMHELDRRPQVNVLLTPEWLTLRVAIVQAIEPYPAARLAVAKALAEAGGLVSD